MIAVPDFVKGRVAAVTAFAITAALFAILVVTPVIAAFSAQGDEIADSLQQLGFYHAEIAARPALEAELRALDQRGASVPGVIEGDSTALAQAQLQSQIKTIVEANKGDIRSVQVLPVMAQGGFEVIAVECDLTIPQSSLKDLAYAIGVHKPFLFVDEASISAPASEPDDVQHRPPTLDMRWTIHGYRWVRPK